MSTTPFVVGQWVRGERFYGRAQQIEQILRGNRNWLWLLGTRRVGKTSLLKQVEHLTASSAGDGYLPVFWDFQGAASSEELHEAFQEALLDAEERVAALGIRPEEVTGADLFSSLGKLRRRARAAGRSLLLLCDEAEVLITIHEKEPSFLAKLRRALQSAEDIRSVLASTVRLWALAGVRGDTSPFLHGFTPPLYINRLRDDEARALVRQVHLAAAQRPSIDVEIAELICTRCDNHPYLLQLVGQSFVEAGRLDEALERVAADPMVSHFFSIDFEMLSSLERDVVRTLSAAAAADSKSLEQRIGMDASELGGMLRRLEQLGYVRRDAQGRFELVNYFFRRWLQEQPPSVSMTLIPPGARAADPSAGADPQLYAGRYVLIRAVGEGATGTVYMARDTVLNETIAVKRLKSVLCAQPEVLSRFRREILLSRDLNHPNVVRTYHLGDHEGQWYLTMQWIAGPSLAERVRQSGPLDLRQAVATAGKLASALEAAHGRGVIHRDIKPQNVLLDADEEPYLTDFGLSRLVDAPGMTLSGVFVGTPDYASPEQAALATLDERSDIYSLGVMIFFMVTGRKPFAADSVSEVLRMHREVSPPDPRLVRAEIPEACAQVVLRCLQKDPAERFATAADLREALAACAAR